ncbi:methyltransferase domain-containing protein [Streptomyces sp. NPDC020096]
MTSTHQEQRPALDELGRFLIETGSMTSDWAEAFAAVPRSAFLPPVMWPHDMETGRSVPVSKADDPAGWQAAANSNSPIVTQWDDGKHAGMDPGELSTSSASAPAVVFRMLADLDPQPGDAVLELGAGTGYNAGLLAYRVGGGNVVTVDVDPAVTSQARQALQSLGLSVTVVTGDGLLGYPQRAPYDRLIATFGLRAIPGAWVEQTRPGGVIVAPWGTNFAHHDAVARLNVAADGRSASGRFTRLVEFMKARSQRLGFDGHAAYVPEDVPGSADESHTEVPAEDFPAHLGAPARFAIGLQVDGMWHGVSVSGDRRLAWFYSLNDRSWAVVAFRDGQHKHTVYQSGPRRLWDEVEAAWRWWDAAGQPGVGRFGLTVRADGAHEVWLDEPGGLVPVAA